MIFLDTSCIYALADRNDQMHAQAVSAFDTARAANEEVVTHSYVLIESAALLQRRLGLRASLAFLQDAANFTVTWVDEDLHSRAVAHLQQSNLPGVSLVDAVSFLLMRDQGITRYLGFDGHFDNAGFTRYPTPGQP